MDRNQQDRVKQWVKSSLLMDTNGLLFAKPSDGADVFDTTLVLQTLGTLECY